MWSWLWDGEYIFKFITIKEQVQYLIAIVSEIELKHLILLFVKL